MHRTVAHRCPGLWIVPRLSKNYVFENPQSKESISNERSFRELLTFFLNWGFFKDKSQSTARSGKELYSYFEKGCRKKCTQQSRNKGIVGGVFCSSKTFERMARETMHVCLRVLKEINKEGSTATVSGTVYWAYLMLPFGIVACTAFSTTFLEITICFQRKLSISF